MQQVGRERFYESYMAQVCTLVRQITYPGDDSEVKKEGAELMTRCRGGSQVISRIGYVGVFV
jgi:hypothetical protein